MNITDQQLEWIVQEVIRRLRQLDGTVGSSNTAPGNGGELRLTERVVTIGTLENRLANVSRVIVQPRAVVTPAVRDELKQRQIQLVRQNH